MGRRKIVVDKSELLQAIKTVEANQTFTTRNDLAEAVANLASMQDLGVTKSVVLLRIKDFGLDSEIKTKKGKRGRQPGNKLTDEQKAAMQQGRQRNFNCVNIKELRREFPDSKQGLLDRVEKGSLRAAINAMCESCSNFQGKEIKYCTVIGCPLYSFRKLQAENN